MASMSSLSTEVVLRILACLDDAQDVARVRQTNRRMYALAGDPMLWKRLFTEHFLVDNGTVATYRPHTKRLRRNSNASLSSNAALKPALSSRHVSSLPSLAQREDEEAPPIDWYTLFKVSRNWQTGNYTAHQLRTALQAGIDPDVATKQNSLTRSSQLTSLDLPDTVIASSADFVFIASRARPTCEAKLGQVLVFPMSVLGAKIQAPTDAKNVEQEAFASFTSAHHQRSMVSALAVDSASARSRAYDTRILVAYSSGALSVASFDGQAHRFTEMSFKPAPTTTRDEASAMAAFHWPYIATCTSDFRIRVYRASEGITTLHLVEERRSYSCYWPATLRMEPLSSTLRLSVTYCHPVYPSGWTVGLQEILLGEKGVSQSRSASAKLSHVVTRIDSPTKQARKGKDSPSLESSLEQITRLTSLSYEDPFVVVGTRDNEVFCFRVDGAATQESDGVSWAGEPQPLSVHHVRTLHGHTGTVHSVSLDGGRCVTGGSDGSVRVWRLGDEERSLARATGLLATLDGRLRREHSGGGNVITLQLANPSSSKKRKRSNSIDDKTATIDGISSISSLTLADIIRHARQAASLSVTVQKSSTSVIRWVASAFDRIISVSSASSATAPVRACGQEAMQDIAFEEEQVQVWSFAS